jgi:5'-3' exonuclease
MIIVDFSAVMISNLMVEVDSETVTVEESLLRHMILNSIRAYNHNYRDQFGEMVIACDDSHYWRKEVFPYYKANRAKTRAKSKLDWNSIFVSLNKIKAEVKEYLPYRVIQYAGAEADDVIGTLVQEHGGKGDPILILSGDKDFVQLHGYMGVKQYDPVRKKWIATNDAASSLKELIIRGDTGDGVPNFLSPDNCLVIGERQKSIMQKKLDVWLTQELEEFCDKDMLQKFKRNQQLIDLTFTPNDIRTGILCEYESQQGKNRSKIFNYFIEKKLKHLMEAINEF